MTTAFLNLPVSFGIRRILKADVRQRMRGDGKVERTFVSGHIQHRYEIPWPAITRAMRTTQDAFMVTCAGRYVNDIAYSDPWDNQTVTCRLDQDIVEMMEVAPLRQWSSSFKLIEIADWQALKAAVTAFPSNVPFQQVGMGIAYRTEIQESDDNAELRYQDYPSGIRKWMVGGEALSFTQASSLLACWEGNCGPWKAFSFTDPETSTSFPNCHFVETECTHTLTTRNASSIISSIRLTVEQLLS